MLTVLQSVGDKEYLVPFPVPRSKFQQNWSFAALIASSSSQNLNQLYPNDGSGARASRLHMPEIKQRDTHPVYSCLGKQSKCVQERTGVEKYGEPLLA